MRDVMSKLMWIAGILLVAVGVALGLMVFVSPTSIIGWGITPEVATLMLVGGILAIGLGSVISALELLALGRAVAPVDIHHAEVPSAPIPEFGRRTVETAATVAAAAPAMAEDVSEPVKETIEALEQARQKIEQAFEPKADAPAEPVAAPEAVEIAQVSPAAEDIDHEEPLEAEPVEEEAAEEGQLYVVEERLIRSRSARILSDGTVEAETEEGWMRFENLEHLDEYLDAMAPAARS
jgi:hypothetical protein